MLGLPPTCHHLFCLSRPLLLSIGSAFATTDCQLLLAPRGAIEAPRFGCVKISLSVGTTQALVPHAGNGDFVAVC
jgi:hypothetical protein